MKNIYLTLIFLTTSLNAFSGYPIYGSFSYNWLDSNRVEIITETYRDCRGIPVSDLRGLTIADRNYGVKMSIPDSMSKKISIEAVTPVCRTAKQPCSPANKSGTGEGHERHVYRTVIDLKTDFGGMFDTMEYFMIGQTVCCRSSSYTNVVGGNASLSIKINRRFWKNNSARFNNIQPEFISLNQPYRGGLGLQRPDGDSMHIEFAAPRGTSPSNDASYRKPYTKDLPIKAYYPGGILHLVNPRANPPVGIYLNSSTGELVFTPTETGIFILAFKVQEWDEVNGKMELMSEYYVEKHFTSFTGSSNNPPKLIGPEKTTVVCADDSVLLEFQTEDITYIPPPGGTIIKDSLTISYTFEGSGEEMTIPNTPQPKLTFKWNPNQNDVRDEPYLLTIKVKDDNCPLSAVSYFTYKVYVKPKFEVDFSKSNEDCNEFLFNGKLTYGERLNRQIFVRTIGDPYYDPINDYIVKLDPNLTGTTNDTVLIINKGTYTIESVHTSSYGCSKTFRDTVVVSQSLPALFSKDTAHFCKNTGFTIQSDLVNLDTFAFLSFDTIRVWDQSGYERIFCEAYPQSGCPSADVLHLFKGDVPEVRFVTEPDTLCLPFKKSLAVLTNNQVQFRDTVIWENSVPSTYYEVTKASNYGYQVKNKCGSIKGSIRIDTFPNHRPVRIIGVDALCAGSQTLTATPKMDSLYWENGSESAIRTVNQTGEYTVYSKSVCGMSSATINIQDSLFVPNSDLGGFKNFCKEIYHELKHEPKEGEQILWSNGRTDTFLKVRQPGWYWVEVTNKCGVDRDSFEARLFYDPIRTVPMDSGYCKGESLILDAGNKGADYAWSTGETTQEIKIDSPGTYSVKVMNFCSHPEFNIVVTEDEVLTPDLGLDTMLKKPFKLELNAGQGGNKYMWNTGEETQSILVQDWGSYVVTVTNSCGEFKDTIEVSQFLGNPTINALAWRAYPNPTHGNLYFEGLKIGDQIKVVNALGQLVLEQEIDKETIIQLPESRGVYQVIVKRDGISLGTLSVIRN